MYPKNSASPPRIAIGAVVQISDGAVQTSGCTVRILAEGGAEGDGGGTTAYSTDGVVLYTPTQAETNYTAFLLIAKKTGCIPACVSVVTTAAAVAGKASLDTDQAVNVTKVNGTAQTAGDLAALIAVIDGIVDTIVARVLGTIAAGTHVAQSGDSYARLGAPVGASISADIADVEGKVDDLEGRVIGTIAAGTHNPQSGDAYARLGAPAGASVSADIAAIEAQTDDIGVAGAGLTALATAAELAKVPKSDGSTTFNATCVGDIKSGLSTQAELAKVPKSDGVVTWNATALGSIQTECNDALVANNLDHLMKTAVADISKLGDGGGNEVPDSTVLSLMLCKGTDTDTFNHTTDSLEGQQELLATAAGYIDTEVAAIKAKTDNLPASPAAVGSQMDLVNAPNATAVTAIQNGLATSAALATVDDFLDTEVAAILAAVDTEVAAIKTQTDLLPSGIKKNTALANFEFFMALASDHVSAATGKTITAARSIDGGAFGACANAAAEVSNGVYKIALAAADLNGDVITLRFSEAACDDTFITIKTQA